MKENRVDDDAAICRMCLRCRTVHRLWTVACRVRRNIQNILLINPFLLAVAVPISSPSAAVLQVRLYE